MDPWKAFEMNHNMYTELKCDIKNGIASINQRIVQAPGTSQATNSNIQARVEEDEAPGTSQATCEKEDQYDIVNIGYIYSDDDVDNNIYSDDGLDEEEIFNSNVKKATEASLLSKWEAYNTAEEEKKARQNNKRKKTRHMQLRLASRMQLNMLKVRLQPNFDAPTSTHQEKK